jgi:hypothetical protein
MRKWFAADEKEIADMISARDIDHVARFPQSHAATFSRIKLVDGESAEIAFRIADIRDGELEITRPAVPQHVPQECERTFFSRKDRRRGWNCGSGRFRRRPIDQCIAHSKRAILAGIEFG